MLHEHERYADGRCLSRLIDPPFQARGIRSARRMEHVSVWFLPAKREAAAGAEPDPGRSDLPARRVGLSGFRRAPLRGAGPLRAGLPQCAGRRSADPESGASATVSGGNFPEAEGPLGSPFPLDAAMHAACAWGQRYRQPGRLPRRHLTGGRSSARPGRLRPTSAAISPLPDEGAVPAVSTSGSVIGTDGRLRRSRGCGCGTSSGGGSRRPPG
ncbi:MAG: hypothetical protein MZV70_67625 [Desulfobacterales bacterium]|nr:hypothetical protein [Desulfobacterales bacterium]